MKQWEKGEILISREPKTLVLYMGDGITDGTFKGRTLESENFRLENSVMVNWSREAFEIATKENTPRKWWKYFPLPNWKDGDFLVGGSFTDIDGQKVKAIVIFKNYYDATDFIGERISPFKDGRRIRGSYGIYDFELATKENTPKELWNYLPTTIADVAQEITNIMRGEDDMKDELKIGDIALVKSCSSNNENYSKLIGCRGKIVGTSVDRKEYKMLFESLPDKFNVGNFHLHDCGKEDICKYIFISKLDVTPVDNPEPTLMISKDKKILVEFIEATNKSNFKGRILRDTHQGFPFFKVGDCGSFWIKDAFELATKDNVPYKWGHILLTPKKIEEIKEIVSKCVEIKRDDKYQVIKLNPTENQERQYGVMLIKNLTEIIEGKTIAFINSKGSGGVIYGRKANGLLHKLVISNPHKVITVVKTLKAHGKKQESIKQISIKIDDATEDSQFVL